MTYRYTVYYRIHGTNDYRRSFSGNCEEFKLIQDHHPDSGAIEFVTRNMAGVGHWEHGIWEIKPDWMVVVKDENNEIVYSSFENGDDVPAPEQRRNPEHGLQLYDERGNEIDAI